MTVVVTFAVGFSHGRPIRPDSVWSWVTIALSEDTPRAYEEARTLAAQFVGTRHAMVTSVTLASAQM